MEQEELDEIASAENRWAHLLKPIKDLAENWNINIANDLEEYLVELESINHSKRSPNFAEAALLIHGSVGVYSKKVEHLYHLVTQTMELLISKKLKKQSSITADGVDKDVAQEEEVEFLPLDDLAEATNIDMTEQDGPNDNITFSRDLGVLSFGHMSGGNGDGEDVNFQMRNCTISKDGALVLGQNALFLDMGESELPLYQIEDPLLSNSLFSNSNSIHPATDVFQPIDDFPDPPMEVGAFPEHEEGGDISDDGGMDIEAETPQGEKPRTPKKKVIEKKKKKKSDQNPWDHYDPHDQSDVVVKPFRRAKTYKIPASLQDSTQEDETTKKKTRKPTTKKIDSNQSSNVSFTLKPNYEEFQYLYDRDMKFRKKKTVETSLSQPTTTKDGAEISKFEQVGIRDESEHSDNESSEEEIIIQPIQSIASLAAVPGEQWGLPGESLLGMNVEEIKKINEETSYDDLCRSYFEKYLQDAKQYAIESDQTRRIETWKARLQPLLNEQVKEKRQIERKDKRPSYSIQSFAHTLLHQFPPKNKKEDLGSIVPFSTLVSGKTSWEICRAFVATLHMVNAGNIDLKAERDLENGNDKIRCTLLSREQVKDIENFVPASTSTKKTKNSKEKEDIGEDEEISPEVAPTNKRKQSKEKAAPKNTKAQKRK